MGREFNQRFGIDTDLPKAKENFVNRIYNLVFRNLRRTVSADRKIIEIKAAAIKVGVDAYEKPGIENIVAQDYYKVLEAVGAIYNESGASEDRKQEIDQGVRKALEESEVDLGIRWENELPGKYDVAITINGLLSP